MLWAIYCVGKPNTEAARAAILQPHRDYLQSRKGIIVMVGQLQDDDGNEPVGSLRIVNVKSRAEAQAFSDGDPLVQAGVFASITITRMRKGQLNPAVADRE